jgi:hypothetical protein
MRERIPANFNIKVLVMNDLITGSVGSSSLTENAAKQANDLNRKVIDREMRLYTDVAVESIFLKGETALTANVTKLQDGYNKTLLDAAVQSAKHHS